VGPDGLRRHCKIIDFRDRVGPSRSATGGKPSCLADVPIEVKACQIFPQLTALDSVYDYVRTGSGLEIEILLKPELGLPSPLKASFQNIHFATLRQIAYEVLTSPAILSLK
jgi:hypothetical protein